MFLPYHIPSEIELTFHCSSSLLAYSVKNQFPNATLIGGGTNSIGFYFDFVFKQALSDDLLELIETHLRTVLKEDRSIQSLTMMRENAVSLFRFHRQPFLARETEECEDNTVNLLQIEKFYTLCPAFTFKQTTELGCVKLLKIETFSQVIKQDQLTITRIHGTTRQTSREIKVFSKLYDHYLKKKDHRLIGPQLQLFHVPSLSDPFQMTWYPKGLAIQNCLKKWLNEQILLNEQMIQTSPVTYLKNSHGIADSPFFEWNDEEYDLFLSPTKQHLDYLTTILSLEDKKIKKVSEDKIVCRLYSEAKRWGWLCSNLSTQQQTTISCLNEQLQTELISSLHFIEQMIIIFGFEAYWVLVASKQKTQKAQKEREAIKWLKQAVSSSSLSFIDELEEAQEEIEGPRLELRVQDSIERHWTLSTIGIISHVNVVSSEKDQANSNVVMTRCIWNSLERLVALLVEQYNGDFPLWLAPVQVRILCVGEANHAYAKQIKKRMQEKGLRVELDLRQDKLGVKIHQAEKEKIPFLVLIGERERSKEKISVRLSHQSDQHQLVEVDSFLDKLYRESLYPTIKGTVLKGESELA